MYGGIHYRFDLVQGNKIGKQIGAIIDDRLRMRRENDRITTKN